MQFFFDLVLICVYKFYFTVNLFEMFCPNISILYWNFFCFFYAQIFPHTPELILIDGFFDFMKKFAVIVLFFSFDNFFVSFQGGKILQICVSGVAVFLI